MGYSPGNAPQPAGTVVYPLADGRTAWAVGLDSGVHTGVCGQYWPQEGIDEIIDALAKVLPPRISYLKVGGIRNRTIWARFAPDSDTRVPNDWFRAKRLRTMALRALPDSRLHVPRARRTLVAGNHDPYLLAGDGSGTIEKAAWAYVTGAGWYSTGIVDTSSSLLAAWIAACEGINLFRPGSNLTLLIDNTIVGAVIQDIADGTKPRKPKWASDVAYDTGRNIVLHRNVSVRRIRRNTHPLHAMADRLCGEVSRSRMDPTASSSPAQRARSIWSRLA